MEEPSRMDIQDFTNHLTEHLKEYGIDEESLVNNCKEYIKWIKTTESVSQRQLQILHKLIQER